MQITPNRLEILLERIKGLEHDLQKEKEKKRSRIGVITYLEQILDSIKYKIKHFGQRYNIVHVEITWYDTEDRITKTEEVYFTDISTGDAAIYISQLYKARGIEKIAVGTKEIYPGHITQKWPNK